MSTDTLPKKEGVDSAYMCTFTILSFVNIVDSHANSWRCAAHSAAWLQRVLLVGVQKADSDG